MLNEHLNSFLLGNKLKLLSMKRISKGHVWEVQKASEPVACLRCGSVRTVKAGRCTTTVREEPLRHQTFWLKIHKHRIYCKDCKKTFTESVPGIWPKRRSTQRFRKFIAQSCERSSDLSTVSRSYHVSHGFCYKAYYEQVEIKLREHQDRIKWPEVVGLDEHFFRRKNGFTEFVSLFADLRKRTVFEVAHGKDHLSLMQQLEKIPGRENVKVVVIDMSGTYRSFVKKFFPNARIVADKFHVMRLFTPHLMKRGKEIHGHRQELKTRRKLLWSRQKLDYFIRSDIDRYLKDHALLDELYRWKEKLYEFYRIKGYDRAVIAFDKLLLAMKESKLEEVQRIHRTFTRWKNEILFYFQNGYTNGFTERMNGTGKLVQRRAFGYKSFRNYRMRTLSACLFRAF